MSEATPKPPERNIELEICFLLRAKKTFRVSVAINPPETDPDVLGGSLPTSALEVLDQYGREVYDKIVHHLHLDEAVAKAQEMASANPNDVTLGVEIKEKEEICPINMWLIDSIAEVDETGGVEPPFIDYVNLCKKCGHDHSKDKGLPPTSLLNEMAKDLGFSSYTREEDIDDIDDKDPEDPNGVAGLLAQLFGGGGDKGLAILKIDENGKMSQLKPAAGEGATPGTKIFSADD